MVPMLQISEVKKLKFPKYFETFLENCFQDFPDSFFACDFIFAAIYFIILDSGFCPVDLYEKFPNFCTTSFDIRKLNAVQRYAKKDVHVWYGSRRTFMIYNIPVRLGHYSHECEIQAVPSSENHKYIIVNLLRKHNIMVQSLCLKMSRYLMKTPPGSKFPFTFKNVQHLSNVIKNRLCNPIRESIMIEEERGCCAHLLRLPEAIQSKIIYYMRDNPRSVHYLSSSCSYFHNVMRYDSKLWQKLCFTEFHKKRVNRTLLEVFENGNDDSTIFKQAYIRLKKRAWKRRHRTYRYW